MQIRHFLILTLLFFILQKTSGQNNDNQARIDSLEAMLSTKQELNEERVDLLNALGYEYWIVDPSKSEEYGVEALEISKVLPYPKGKAFANRVIGVSHWVRGNLDLSFKFLLEAEALYRSVEDSLGLANSMLNLGMAYADQQNFTSATHKYNQALDLFARLGEDSRIATTYTKMAELLILKEDYQDAYDYLIKALDIHKENNFLYGIAEANSKLGKVFMARQEYNEAISYLLLAVEAAKQRNDHVGLADYYQSIGASFLYKKDYQQAKNYLDSSLELAQQYDLKKILREIFLTFKNLEEERGNYQSPLDYYDKYLAVKDELFNEEKSNIIANMEAQRAYDKKEQQLQIAQKNLALLEQKNRAGRLALLALILGLLALGALAWGLLQRKNKKLIENRKSLQKAEQKTDELQDAIKSKEQELTSYTLNFVQKNELIAEVKDSINQLKSGLGSRHRMKLDGLARKIDSVSRMDEDWSDFGKHFESVHPTLMKNLNRDFPDLTKNEFKLIALIRLNLSSKEISSVLGISPDSVKTARYRLRKKLRLDNQEDLFDFLINYDQVKPGTE